MPVVGKSQIQHWGNDETMRLAPVSPLPAGRITRPVRGKSPHIKTLKLQAEYVLMSDNQNRYQLGLFLGLSGHNQENASHTLKNEYLAPVNTFLPSDCLDLTGGLLLIVISIFVLGCDDQDQARAYRSSKEAAPAPALVSAPMMDSGMTPARMGAASADLTWDVPQGWSQQTGGGPMRFATITRTGMEPKIEITVTKLPRQAEALLANVNRWRGQMGLAEVNESGLSSLIRPLEGGNLPATLVDLSTGMAHAHAESPQRMLASIVHTSEATWFFKVRSGPDIIQQAEHDILAIFKSVRTDQVHSHQIPSMAQPQLAQPSIPTGPETPLKEGVDGQHMIGPLTFHIPEGWSLDPQPRTARLATLTFSDNGAEGEMAITRFPGNVGGELANVNRWRGQLGLTPIGDLSHEKITQVTISGQAEKTYMFSSVDNAPVKRGILVSSFQHQGLTWFFKMTGPAPLIQNQAEQFQQFLSTIQFSN